MSWPAEELRSEVDEGISNANEDPNLAKAYRLGNEAYKALKNEPARAQAAQEKIEAEFPQYAKMWLTGYRDGERFDKQSVAESHDPVADLRRLLG
jgi:curved DNA-binding protein CbpA